MTSAHFTEHIQSVLIIEFNRYLDPLGSKGLLQPTLGANLAWAIRTLKDYAIFALSSGVGLERGWSIYYQLKWFRDRPLSTELTRTTICIFYEGANFLVINLLVESSTKVGVIWISESVSQCCKPLHEGVGCEKVAKRIGIRPALCSLQIYTNEINHIWFRRESCKKYMNVNHLLIGIEWKSWGYTPHMPFLTKRGGQM